MKTRTMRRRAHRTTWLGAGGWIIVAACGNESVNVLTPRDVSVVTDADGQPVDGSVDASIDVAVEPAIDVSIDPVMELYPIEAAMETGPIDAPAEALGPRDGATPTGCRVQGAGCTFASECCLLACLTPDGGNRVCVDGPQCAGATKACTNSAECCADSCVSGQCRGVSVGAGACLPAGEPCTPTDKCCGGLCEIIGGELRCALLSDCHVVGEICRTDRDCCSGACRGDDRRVPVCVAAPTCTLGNKMCWGQAGDRCDNHSDCCTGPCMPLKEGVSRCTATAGCGVECAFCTQPQDCCVGSECRSDDGGGYWRCVTGPRP